MRLRLLHLPPSQRDQILLRLQQCLLRNEHLRILLGWFELILDTVFPGCLFQAAGRIVSQDL